MLLSLKVWELLLIMQSSFLFEVRLRRVCLQYISISLKPKENVLYQEANVILQNKYIIYILILKIANML